MKTETKTLSKEVMRKLAEELLTAQKSYDVDKLLRIYHPNCLIEHFSLGLRHKGHSSVRAGITLVRSIFHDYEMERREWAYEKNTLVSWGMVKLTLAGTFNGHVPNGSLVSIMNFTLLKFDDNMVSYEGHFLDQATLCLKSGIPMEAFIQTKT